MQGSAATTLIGVLLFAQIACAVRHYNYPTSYADVAEAKSEQQSSSKSDWPNLFALKAGDRVIVRLKNGSLIEGRLKKVTDEFILVSVPSPLWAILKTQRQAQRSKVATVEKKIGNSEGKGMVWGAVIGGAIGYLIAYLAIAKEIPEDRQPAWVGQELGTAAGLGMVAGIGYGALIGSILQKKVLVYEAKPPIKVLKPAEPRPDPS